VLTEADVHRVTVANRLLIAEVLEGLEESQWDEATLSRGWTVRHVAAHLLQPFLVGFGRFFVVSLRFRGDTDRTVAHLTRRLARLDPADIVTLLRAHAREGVSPPRVGPWGPFAETCIHLRDIARPLGLGVDVGPEQWLLLLDYLTSARAAPALVPRGRLDGLELTVAGAGWSRGSGASVTGAPEPLAMAVTGRATALEELHGPGVELLGGRLGEVTSRS
jgi:uncharacterized protein (TIGR03083 family)